MHLSSVLQCHIAVWSMLPPEFELLVDERIGAIAFDEKFCLFEVAKGFEWVIGRPGVVNTVLQGVRISDKR